MAFIKYHWFGLLMSLLFGFYLIVFLIGFFYPDTFEGCTLEMVEDMTDCQSNFWCSFNVIINNIFCQIRSVI